MHHGLGICINLAVQATSLLGSLGGMGCCWVSHSTFASMGFQFSVSLFISVQISWSRHEILKHLVLYGLLCLCIISEATLSALAGSRWLSESAYFYFLLR